MSDCGGVRTRQMRMRVWAFARFAVPWALLVLLVAGCAPLEPDPVSLPLQPERTLAPPGIDPLLQKLFETEDRYLVDRGRPAPANTRSGADGTSWLFMDILSPRPHHGIAPNVKDEDLPLYLRYFLGRGVEQDAAEGMRLMVQAEEAGSLYVTCRLAQVYDDGIQTAQNRSKALALYKKCLPEDPTKAVRIGEMYELGLGTEVDYKRAMHYYILATMAHMSFAANSFNSSWRQIWHVQPEYRIGRLYAQGKGVPRHYSEAAGWFTRATQFGKQFGNSGEYTGLAGTRSRCALAIMYSEGLGVTKDPSTAKRWRDMSGVKSVAPCDTLDPHW